MLNPQKNNSRKVTFGKVGEDYAEELLRIKGYKIIKRNFRSKFGEIDVIAVDNDTLVFVEVKARWSHKFGLPEEAVTPKKIAKIKKASYYFNLLNPDLPKKQRIDVVAIDIVKGKVQSARIIKVI